QPDDVIVDVLVDIGEHLLQLFRLDLRQIRLNLRVAVRPDAQLRLGRHRRRGGCLGRRFARAADSRHSQNTESGERPAHRGLLPGRPYLRVRRDTDERFITKSRRLTKRTKNELYKISSWPSSSSCFRKKPCYCDSGNGTICAASVTTFM